jgi:hypothetical protein
MPIEYQMGILTCLNCNNKLWIASHYDAGYYHTIKCIECNNYYLKKEKDNVKQCNDKQAASEGSEI